MNDGPGRLPRLITGTVGLAAGLFYEVDRHGPPLPSGPVLVAANHPNSLVDPLLVFRCGERATRPLAKAPLFEKPILGSVLRALGGIPVYRRQDDPAAMHRNEDMFRAAVGVLLAGGAIQIYPEGRSHSEPRLVELRTGAARIALQAEDAAYWGLGLSIVPVGITYGAKALARTPVAVRFGPAFACTDLRSAYRYDPSEAVRILTERIDSGIRAETLNFVHEGDRQLVEVAERLYVRGSGWVPWRAREGLGTRLPRLQRFAAALEWIRREAPDEHEALKRKVERYQALHGVIGAGEGEVPPRYGLVPVARYILVQGTLLVAGAPLALAGALLWYPVTRIPALVTRTVRPDLETTATYKLIGLLFGVVALWAVWVWLAFMVGGAATAVVTAVFAPVAGYLALQWRDLAAEVVQDTRLFFRLQGRPDVRERFARQRKELVDAFRRLEKRLISTGDDDNVTSP